MNSVHYVSGVLIAVSLFFTAFVVINPHHKATKMFAHTYANVKAFERYITDSPTGGYAPATVECPAFSLLRNVDDTTGLSVNETAWLTKRHDIVYSAWRQYLTQVNVPGLDINGFLSDNTTLGKIGISFSGGGFRAMLNGAGIINALDGRNLRAVDARVGGVAQLLTYISGLSGGGFLVASLAINGFPQADSLKDLWNLEQSVLAPGGANIFTDIGYYGRLIRDVREKEAAGFEISITDIWGRAMAYKLYNGSAGTTYSSIQNVSAFATANMPFPILLSDGRDPGQLIIPPNSTIYEFNPFEFGSWSPRVRGFTPIQYLGTNLTNGQPTQANQCVEGFDNFGFVVGTSSSLFNQGLLRLNTTSEDILGSIIEEILERIGEADNDIAVYPNPYYKFREDILVTYNDLELNLVDGGEDGENIPLVPLLQKERGVDTIIAIDSSADTEYFWPNGSSLVATYEGSIDPRSNNTVPFPPVPAVASFINLGLNQRMTFFGCPNASDPNSGPSGPYPYPLVIYLPNYPYSFATNSSSFRFTYSEDDVDGFFGNGFAQLTNNTETATCLACALVQRTLARRGQSLPTACQTCFDNHCWNGERNDAPPATYEPTLPAPRDAGNGNNNAASALSTSTPLVLAMFVIMLIFW
jgi:lysophospholipase